LNALVFFYQTIALHDFGIAIILTTLLIRFVLYPLFHKGAHQQAVMQRIQPKIKKIQEIHKDDREKQTRALMELYKEHGVNPISSLFLLLIQLPILIALYGIIRSGIGQAQIDMLYFFIQKPAVISHSFLGVINLEDKNFLLVLLAAIAQYIQARMMLYTPKSGVVLSQAEKMGRQMAYIGPLVTLFVFYNLPAAVGLYWLVASLFAIGQQYIVNIKIKEKFKEE
jgi:YidC/Oxa1 family membrane protein insertase